MLYKGYFDGSSKGNPGIAQCGWAIVDTEGNVINHDSRTATKPRTNNYAEYMGLIELLTYLNTNEDITNIDIYGDSKLVVMQVRKKWKCRSASLRPLCFKAIELFESLLYKKHMTLQWVPRDQNTIADSLAQKGIL